MTPAAALCRSDVGNRSGDGAGAGEARREAGAAGAAAESSRGDEGAHTGRVPRLRNHRYVARSQQARLRSAIRSRV